jgi:membrane protein implicated in regulation of membrane protease activity
MKHWLRDNGLTLALFAIFLLSLIGHGWSGWLAENEERLREGASAIDIMAYLAGGAFLSSLFENWESEFLQMAAFVILTAYLYQRGSPESRDPDDPPGDREQPYEPAPNSPWPTRAKGLALQLYEHSLGLALIALFLVSFGLHAVNSARHAADEALIRHTPPPSLWEHVASAEFWFESFQNWQSEFLSTAVLIVLTIYLRERGSSQSKPVHAPHSQTGEA